MSAEEIGFDQDVSVERQQFAQAMQRVLAERYGAQNDASPQAELLAQQGLGEVIDPRATPGYRAMNRLTPDDWEDIRTAPEPFLALHSRVNRRAIEDRYASKKGGGEGAPSTPQDQFAAMSHEARMEVLPLIRSDSAESLSKAVEHGSFLSNRTVAEMTERVNGFGSTMDEDRELGLDTFVFFDYGRPRVDRLGPEQAEVIIVLNPDAMQQPGTVITDHDHADILNTGEYDPERYVHGLTTAEDFRATAFKRIALVASRESHWQDGVQVSHPLTVDMWLDGQDGDWDQFDRRPGFSTWEVKVPDEVSTEPTERLIFRDQAARDAYVAKHGDQPPAVVVPDVKQAMARGEDVFGTEERYKAALDRRIHAEYLGRKAAFDQAPAEGRTVEYHVVGPDTTTEYNPDWQPSPAYDSPDAIIKERQELDKVAGALRDLFADEPDDYEPLPKDTFRIAKVVRAGDITIIESIEEH